MEHRTEQRKATRVLVTGAAGFIGSHLVDRLRERGYAVTALDDLSTGRRENLARYTEGAGFGFVQADVRDGAAVRRAAEGADTIIHLAAAKIPRYGNATQTLLVNAEGSRNILEASAAQGATILLASTSDVYGKSDRLPLSEGGDLVIGPSTTARWAYAVSKLFEEHLALACADANGTDVRLLRFFNGYGPRHHRSWWGGPQSVFIDAVLEDRELQIHGDGLQRRCFSYVDDLVAGTVSAMECCGARGEIFNLGNAEEITILGLARLIHELCDTGNALRLSMVPYASFPGRYEDVRRRIPDLSKAERVLGYHPAVSLRDGLLRTIEWHRHSPRNPETSLS